MEAIKSVFNFFVTQIFQTPAYFMGLVVLLGCLLQKKEGKVVVSSVIKAVVGMMILNVGSGQLKNSSQAIIELFTAKMGIQGVSTDMWTAIYAMLDELATINMNNIATVMLTAWVINLLLAKFTPIKTIFLTGHVAYMDSCYLTFIIWRVTGLTGVALFITAACVCALYWWFMPHLLRKFLVPLLGESPLTLGHNLCLGGILATQISKLFGKPEDSSEKLNLPGWLSIFKDSVISYSVIMGVIYMIIILICGKELVSAKAGSTNWILYGLNQGLNMAVGVYILLSGVRMFLGELIPAFKGFSDKLVPGAIAAVDSPVFWSYAPTAAMLGFLAQVVGQFVGVALLLLFKSPVVAIPSVIPLFFGGCTLGVFANSTGGWKGTIGASFIMGIIVICGSAGLASLLNFNYVPGHSDWSTLWLALVFIGRMIFGYRTA